MSAIQIIIAATTGLFVPPMHISATAGPNPEPCIGVVKSAVGEVACQGGEAIEVAPARRFNDAQGAAAECEGQKVVHLVVEADDEDEAADGSQRKILVSVARGDIEPGGPWLGVRFGPVPKPLASHLRLEPGTGQMVLNIAEDSPADDAGFEQYDVIVNIDGVKAVEDVGEFLDVVRGFEPAETHAFSLIRGGSPTQTSVTIGERPESIGKMKFKFEVAPEGLSQDNVFFRGGMLKKDDIGQWSFDRLGDMRELHDIWEAVPELDGDDLELSIQGKFFPEARQQYLLQLLDDGKSIRLEVKKSDDGQITVTKTTSEDGEEKTTTHTYANKEEFEKADPAAFSAHQGCTTEGLGGAASNRLHQMLMLGELGELDDLRVLKDLQDIKLDIEIDTDHLKDAIGELHKQMGKLKEGHNVFKKELSARFGHHRLDTVVDEAAAAKATTRFTVDPDGKITVTIRRGEDELVENYNTPEQLKKARPDLYEKYQGLVETKAD